MFVKTTYDVSNLDLTLTVPLELPYGDERAIRVVFEHLKEETRGSYQVTATGEAAPPEAIRAVLEAGDKDGLPTEVQRFLHEEHREIDRRLDATVKVLRWRCGISEDETSSVFRGSQWSLDGTTWHDIKDLLSVRFRFGVPRNTGQVKEEALKEVRSLVEKGVEEPLARQIFRKAWSQVENSPRSALVMAIVAAEVGFKDFVAGLVPDAEWLVKKIPSPPLDRMYREYLPLLPVRLRFEGRALRPPKRLLKVLEEGIRVRNELAHAGRCEPQPAELDEILRVVNDLLWILDYYSGFPWAIGNVRPDVLRAWETAAT